MSAPSGPKVAILAAVRTPIGRYGGALRMLSAPQLGAVAARAAIERAGLTPDRIEEVLFGHAIQAGVGQNPARQVLRGAGIPDTIGAATVNMVCGSGMKTIHWGFTAIRAGDYDRVLVGGMESMSNAPYLLEGAMRWGSLPGPHTLDDAMQRDSLIDAYEDHELMGLTGERVAEKFHLTRPEIDAYALRSHLRASESTSRGLFRSEIAPVAPGLVPGAPGLDHDEAPRADTTLEKLARLPPVFRPGGLLTAGNASKLSDGAAALVLASEAEVARTGARPIAWVHSTAESGVHPRDVMESPIPTVRAHLAKSGFSVEDFDRVEHNEAYSSASLAVQRTFGFRDDRFNVRGGAVALGHPIGASGARIVVTLVHELIRSNGHLGLATLCMGGGNGLSVVVERPNA